MSGYVNDKASYFVCDFDFVIFVCEMQFSFSYFLHSYKWLTVDLVLSESESIDINKIAPVLRYKVDVSIQFDLLLDL